MSQPMPRYIAHALAFESAETLSAVGIPKSRNEMPRPNRTDSMRARKVKKVAGCRQARGHPRQGAR